MAKSARDQRIDYVEFSVSDIARSRDFYGQAFGWSFKDYGPAYCEFRDGRLTGGFALGGKGNPGGATAGRPAGHSLWGSTRRDQRRVEQPAGRSSRRPMPSRAAAASTSPIRMVTSWRCGRRSEETIKIGEAPPGPGSASPLFCLAAPSFNGKGRQRQPS